MFWVQRLKDEQPSSGWELPYADLVTLLLAVFVLIASMSELRPSARYASVSGSMRGALGFGAVEPASPVELRPSVPKTLAQRLRAVGLSGAAVKEIDSDVLNACDVVEEADGVLIRVAGPACFDKLSARLKPAGESALTVLAGALAGGQARVEVRGHSGDGPVPADVHFRDGLDLSYQRARAVAEALSSAGVDAGRLEVIACGDNDPLAGGGPESVPGANRRVEIIVRAVKAAR
jgi:chemotaxis protein MotB